MFRISLSGNTLEPKDYFYNWLYANALMQNQDLASQMTRFDSFSDIEFNPQKSINCQAKAAAVFVGLSRQYLEKSRKASKINSSMAQTGTYYTTAIPFLKEP